MKRLKAYNNRGAKMTVMSDVAIENNMVPVEGVELLKTRQMWIRRLRSIGPESPTSAEYYQKRMSETETELDKLREQGYYIPLELEFLNPNILEK